jgi:hypothetical protein
MNEHWEQGREEIDRMLASAMIQRISADSSLTNLYLEHARLHLASAQLVQEIDPTGSFQIAYDASRKALAAILAHQGLRATSRGGHRAVEDAIRAQLVPPLARQLNDFGWLRKLRNSSEYPSFNHPTADIADAQAALQIANELLGIAEELIDQMPFNRPETS